jgi:archaellum component FlaC
MLLLVHKKRITLEDLAMMVARGFNEVSIRFTGVETRLDKVETRLNRVETRLDRVETRLDRIENLILTDYRNRLERVEDKIRVLETGRK